MFAKPGGNIGFTKHTYVWGGNLFLGGIPLDKFGWFYARNGTTWSDGVLTMDTGADDIAKLGNIRQVTLIAKLNSLTSLLALKEL